MQTPTATHTFQRQLPLATNAAVQLSEIVPEREAGAQSGKLMRATILQNSSSFHAPGIYLAVLDQAVLSPLRLTKFPAQNHEAKACDDEQPLLLTIDLSR